MPQVFKVGNYHIYFWSNEGVPVEPVHVHVTDGVPTENATKIWITQKGKCLICNNKSDIPPKKLKVILEVIESRSSEIENKWIKQHGSIRYYC